MSEFIDKMWSKTFQNHLHISCRYGSDLWNYSVWYWGLKCLADILPFFWLTWTCQWSDSYSHAWPWKMCYLHWIWLHCSILANLVCLNWWLWNKNVYSIGIQLLLTILQCPFDILRDSNEADMRMQLTELCNIRFCHPLVFFKDAFATFTNSICSRPLANLEGF